METRGPPWGHENEPTKFVELPNASLWKRGVQQTREEDKIMQTGKEEKSNGGQSRKPRGEQAGRVKEHKDRRTGQEREEADRHGGIHGGGRGRGRGGRFDSGRKKETSKGAKGGEDGGPARVKGGGGDEHRGDGTSAKQKNGGTGTSKGAGVEKPKCVVGGNDNRDGKMGTTRRAVDARVRRGGHSVDGRGSQGGPRRPGSKERQQWDRWRTQSTSRAGAHGSHLGYKTLEELSGKDPSVVAITLSSNRSLQEHLCATEMRQDLVEVLCSVLSKAFKSHADRGSLQHLAGIIKDSGFFRTVLPHYLAGMGSEFNPVRRAKYPQQLENILAVLHQVFTIFPSSFHAVSLILTLLQSSMNSLSSSGEDIKPCVEEALQNLQGLVRHFQEKSREGTLRSHRNPYSLLTTSGDSSGEQEPEEDFRTIPIYPTVEEFQPDHRPFLRPNLISQSYKSTHIYLDTQFRLLREDFVQPLRDGVQQLVWLKTERGMTDEALKQKRFNDILVYFDAKVVDLDCTFTGLAHTIKFDIHPLKGVRWENSKRLVYGSLVCLSCDNFKSLLFATVSEREPKELQKGCIQVHFTEESRVKLAGLQTNQVFLMVESTAYFEAYRYVLEGLKEQQENDLPFQRYIVECKKEVQPPSYLRKSDTYDLSSIAGPQHKGSMRPFHSLKEKAWPPMEKLGLDESQMRAIHLALTKELAIVQGPPGTGKTHVGLKIAQALLTNQHLWRNEHGSYGSTVLVVCYTNHALDQFLEGIYKFLKRGIVRVGGRSNSEILKPFNLRELSKADTFKRSLPHHLRMASKEISNELDTVEKEVKSQRTKLECSLRGILHERFLQKFMSNRHWSSLCAPFKVGQEISKSSQIAEWLGVGSTFFLQRETENAKRDDYAATEELLGADEEDFIEIAEEADLIQAERIIEDYVLPRGGRDRRKKGNMASAVRKVGKLMLALNLDNDDEKQAEQSEAEWEMQKEQKKKLKYRIRKELGETTAMTDEEAAKVLDVWTLSLPDRWRLYRLWVAHYRSELRAEALVSEEAYQDAVKRMDDVRRRKSLFLLSKATVIGMTTTGAAKYRSVLQELEPRLVIVEEAAQVLEAHTITTLSKGCQHLILIGDHQQLQPSATVYELAKNFNLEISMFERMVNMGLPYVRLIYQHRMRPDIARLITPHIYPKLENHSSVLDYENIKGVSANMFFVEHDHPEKITDGKSHQNEHEAKFVVALCRYLLLQDYKREQITILTTYTSQFHSLRKLMPVNQFSGVRVHVVDKYQGEENDIILLSLVRSNRQGKAGFLSIPNRVCVALSRAKKGLYCIGSRATLKNVKLWSNIFQTLCEHDQIGTALPLYCQNHPDRKINAASDEDFKQAPEGGCTQPCLFQLDCGHVCASICHPYDPEHKKYKCDKKCKIIVCDQGHKCPLVCYKKCPEQCTVKVPKVIPQCQHTQKVPCHQDPNTFECQEPCQKMLSCGHPCKSTCGGLCTTMCMEKVTLTLQCGHTQQDACFYRTDSQKPKCRNPCKHQLKCGHTCRGSCSKCFQGRFHVACVHQCDHLLVCAHKCKQPCYRDDSSCQKPCENWCIHSKCKKKCGQPCTPCIEPCAWQCPHQRCSKLCHEPCDRPPCTQPCPTTLNCGHPCIGLCGDKCPSKCHTCNYAEVRNNLSGAVDDPDGHFIQLEDCGHIIEYTAMDKHMGMNDNKLTSETAVAIELKKCPKCGTPIRKNRRYGSLINQTLADIEMVKTKTTAHNVDPKNHRVAMEFQWKARLCKHKSLQLYNYMHIENHLKNVSLTATDLWVVQNKMNFLTRVVELLDKQENRLMMQCVTLTENVERFAFWVNDLNQNFTEQQVYDLQRELQRLSYLVEVNICCHEVGKERRSINIQLEVQTIRDILEQSGQFTEEDQQRVKETMKELKQKFPKSGLRISDTEIEMTTAPAQIRHGDWFKCPNGHVYLMTGCGGARESLLCPYCNSSHGGDSQRVASCSQVASAMDVDSV